MGCGGHGRIAVRAPASHQQASSFLLRRRRRRRRRRGEGCCFGISLSLSSPRALTQRQRAAWTCRAVERKMGRFVLPEMGLGWAGVGVGVGFGCAVDGEERCWGGLCLRVGEKGLARGGDSLKWPQLTTLLCLRTTGECEKQKECAAATRREAPCASRRAADDRHIPPLQ